MPQKGLRFKQLNLGDGWSRQVVIKMNLSKPGLVIYWLTKRGIVTSNFKDIFKTCNQESSKAWTAPTLWKRSELFWIDSAAARLVWKKKKRFQAPTEFTFLTNHIAIISENNHLRSTDKHKNVFLFEPKSSFSVTLAMKKKFYFCCFYLFSWNKSQDFVLNVNWRGK